MIELISHVKHSSRCHLSQDNSRAEFKTDTICSVFFHIQNFFPLLYESITPMDGLWF